MEFDCPDLGTRTPGQWVSFAGPLVEREHVKSKRREELKSGKPSGPPKAQGLAPYTSCRRRDEQGLTDPSQRVSKSARAAVIAQQLASKREPRDPSVTWVPPEDETGPIEYKLKISNPHPIRLQQLITQMKFRLSEGAGECFYLIGMEDDGYPKGLGPSELEASCNTVRSMAASLQAVASVVQYLPGAHGRRCAVMQVLRGTLEEVSYTELRVAVAGCVASGKSTLVAVLTHGSNGTPCLDSGKGTARMAVLRHKHELESGRTTSLSYASLGYDEQGAVLNYRNAGGTTPGTMAAEVVSGAAKVVNFIDMGGHHSCLKTALYGMTALLPDYALLCCCAGGGLGRVSCEHLACLVALEVPVAVVVTKVDTVDGDQLGSVVAEVRALCKAAQQSLQAAGVSSSSSMTTSNSTSCAEEGAGQELCPVVTTEAGAEQAAALLSASQESSGSGQQQGGQRERKDRAPTGPYLVVPIIPVSAVTGEGLSVLHAFLHALQPAPRAEDCTAAAAGVAGSAGHAKGLAHNKGSTGMHATTGAATGTAPVAIHASSTGGAPHEPSASAPASGTALHAVSASAPAAAAAGHMELHSSRTSSGGGADGQEPEVLFQVSQSFEVEGVGTVVSGTLMSGVIRWGQTLQLGPTADGRFVEVVVHGIQRAQHIPVRQVRCGQGATLALRPLGESQSLWLGAAAKLPAVGLGAATKNSTAQDNPAQGTAQRKLSANDKTSNCNGHSSCSTGSSADILVERRGASGTDASLGLSSGSCWECEGEASGVPSSSSGLDLTQLDSFVAGHTGVGRGHQEQQPDTALGIQGSNSGCSTSHGKARPAATGVSASSCEGMTAVAHSNVSGSPVAAAPASAAADHDAACDLLEGLFDMEEDVGFGGSAAAAFGASQLGEGGLGGVLDGSWADEDDAPQRPAMGERGKGKAGSVASSAPSASVPAVAARGKKGARQGHAQTAAAAAAADDADADAAVPEPIGLAQPVQQQQQQEQPQMLDLHAKEPSQHRVQELHPAALAISAPSAGHSFLMGSSPPSTRKGSVLLGPGLRTRTHWSFEAAIILLAGHWPPRGLVSGSWPPRLGVDGDAGEVCGAEAAAAAALGLWGDSASSEPESQQEQGCERLDQGRAQGKGQQVQAGAHVPAEASVRKGFVVSPGAGALHKSQSCFVAGKEGAGGAGLAPEDPAAVPAQCFDEDGMGAAPVGVMEGRAAGASGAGCLHMERSRSERAIARKQQQQRAPQKQRQAQRQQRGSRWGEYSAVVHCQNIRQLAHLTSLQEFAVEEGGAAGQLQLPPSLRAAAALLHAPGAGQGSSKSASSQLSRKGSASPPQASSPRATAAPAAAAASAVALAKELRTARSRSSSSSGAEEKGPDSPDSRPDAGCIVLATFKFAHHAEWLREGARLIIRDRSDGHVSGVGVIRRAL